MKIPKTIYSPKSNIMFIAGLVLFVLFFAVVYTPNYGLAEESLTQPHANDTHIAASEWYSHQGLCLPVCCAIILVTTLASRLLMLLTTRTPRLREGEYLLWQLGEVVVSALFCDLFLSLYFHIGFFEYIPTVLLVYVSVAIYPYTIYWLLAERIDRDLRIAEAQRTIVGLRNRQADTDNDILRFADEKGNIKLVVSAENVISIEAAGNYVTILYLSSNRLTRYSLRNTLKGIEELCADSPLMRCHRSYYLNIGKVKLIRRDHDGLFAEIDYDGVGDIPVSKSYVADIMQHFSAK